MRAALDDPPLSTNRIWSACISEAQPVRDDDRHAILGEAFHRRPDALLGAGVDGGGGIVEHQHRWPQHQAAGDGQALPLAAGKRRSAFADDRGVAGRKSDDVVVQLGNPAPLDALLARPGLP
jgi:hypothetical protein